jgi:CheY-like chemotaxis protein
LVEAVESSARLRVLLVDDDAPAGARLAAELRARGVRVAVCGNAQAAVRTLHEHGVDAVLLAIPLGDGDWIAAAAALKAGTSPPALFVLDGSTQRDEWERSPLANCAPDAFLPRSAGSAELLWEPWAPPDLASRRCWWRCGHVGIRAFSKCAPPVSARVF